MVAKAGDQVESDAKCLDVTATASVVATWLYSICNMRPGMTPMTLASQIRFTDGQPACLSHKRGDGSIVRGTGPHNGLGVPSAAHSRTVLSLAVASQVPSGAIATALTGPSWSSAPRRVPSVALNCAVLSLAVASQQRLIRCAFQPRRRICRGGDRYRSRH